MERADAKESVFTLTERWVMISTPHENWEKSIKQRVKVNLRNQATSPMNSYFMYYLPYVFRVSR
jgi:hypothetical protein